MVAVRDQGACPVGHVFRVELIWCVVGVSVGGERLTISSYFGGVWVTRLLLQRGMAAIYFVAFLSVAQQFKPLLGDRGLLPAGEYLKDLRFWDAPSLFHLGYSDRRLELAAWVGLAISGLAVAGATEVGPIWASLAAWLLLWVLYLSVVNVGQNFFGFGWESMLLEAGFFTAFLGPAHVRPSVLPVLILRWMLFRTEVGAGLIKLRHDRCWRDLTCLYYHYETQPLPNPLSWYFHRLPKPFHRFAVLFSHFVQLVVPFGLFAPQPVAAWAAGLIIFHQFWLIVSGNYSWLNWLTAVLGIAGLSDQFLRRFRPSAMPALAPRPLWFEGVLWVVTAGTIALSIQPVMNLFSKRQLMNYSYNRFHLVNTYGAFGSVTKARHEIVIAGTNDEAVGPETVWLEYGFHGKPGDLKRMPPQVAPYHLRLDWMIWFLPFTVAVTPQGIQVRGYERWFLSFVKRLLQGDAAMLRMLRVNPFAEEPPRFVRAIFYRYQFTDARVRRETGAWWTREELGVYLPAVSLEVLKDV